MPTMPDSVKMLCDRYDLTEEEIKSLHRFGLLDVLTYHRKGLDEIESTLNAAYPENVPTPYLRGIYPLAIELVYEELSMSSLFGQRIYDPVSRELYDFMEDESGKYRELVKRRWPERYEKYLRREEEYKRGELKVESYPRLIDRIQVISEETAQNCFKLMRNALNAREYAVVKAYYIQRATVADIAQEQNCSKKAIYTVRQSAIKKLHSYKTLSINRTIRHTVFDQNYISFGNLS